MGRCGRGGQSGRVFFIFLLDIIPVAGYYRFYRWTLWTKWLRRKDLTVESLIPQNSGFRKLKSFQVSQLVYDITVRFVDRYVERYSRSRDQMVQAARSGVQNIAEGLSNGNIIIPSGKNL